MTTNRNFRTVKHSLRASLLALLVSCSASQRTQNSSEAEDLLDGETSQTEEALAREETRPVQTTEEIPAIVDTFPQVPAGGHSTQQNEEPSAGVSLGNGIHAAAIHTEMVSAKSSQTARTLHNIGPSYVLLDGTALKAVFGPVFGGEPRKYSQVTHFKTNPTDFFTPEEEQVLGTYRITVVSTQQRMTDLTGLTQDYMLTLRSFLGDACTKLVNSEMSDRSHPSNQLVRAGLPSESDVNEFMSALYGFAPAQGTHDGAAEYAAVFANAMANVSPQDFVARLKESYTLLCIAAGTDPRVYTR